MQWHKIQLATNQYHIQKICNKVSGILTFTDQLNIIYILILFFLNIYSMLIGKQVVAKVPDNGLILIICVNKMYT